MNASALVSTELKSVTYHDLRLEQDGPVWRARSEQEQQDAVPSRNGRRRRWGALQLGAVADISYERRQLEQLDAPCRDAKRYGVRG